MIIRTINCQGADRRVCPVRPLRTSVVSVSTHRTADSLHVRSVNTIRQHPNRSSWHIAALVLLACIFSACGGVTYTMDAPKQFKRFDDADTYKYITANGVMLKAREVDNYPKAALSFWKDATQKHLEKVGYIHSDTVCFKTKHGLDGCTLTFALPHGAEDWIFQETIFVVSDTLVLVEAAGEFNKFKAIEPDLAAALKTFSPNI
ncbi:MAG: hypothetical protein JXX14_02830 [Deltaproteobacteria bacterium]|nr:hypothetical protein [Deltaproteobacteria bacterium]